MDTHPGSTIALLAVKLVRLLYSLDSTATTALLTTIWPLPGIDLQAIPFERTVDTGASTPVPASQTTDLMISEILGRRTAPPGLVFHELSLGHAITYKEWWTQTDKELELEVQKREERMLDEQERGSETLGSE